MLLGVKQLLRFFFYIEFLFCKYEKVVSYELFEYSISGCILKIFIN